MKDGHKFQLRGRSIDGTVYWTRFGWLSQAHPRIRLWMNYETACARMDAQKVFNKLVDCDRVIGQLCID